MSCVANRDATSKDGGGDAADASPEAETSSCVAPSGGNDLSFDLVCTGDCVGSTHFDFHLDTTSKGYPGCAEGQYKGMGILQFPSSTTNPPYLSGNAEASLALQIEPYGGAGDYTVSGAPSVFSFQATPVFDGGGSCVVTALIPESMPDGSILAEGGTEGASCTIVVTEDCATGPAHVVKGTLACTIPGASSGASCNITHGVFSFGACVP